MGLFSKKKKVEEPQPDATSPAPMPAPTSAPAPLAAPPAAPPPSGKKSKKNAIDPTEFLNLRAELMDMKARLMAAEQSRAIVESRLAALDATALALSNDQSVASGASERLAQLEARVDELGQQPAATTSPDDGAALAELQQSLQARIDALAAQVEQQGAADPEVLSKLTALEAQVVAASAAAETALSEASSAAAAAAAIPTVAPAPAPEAAEPTAAAAPDPEVLARLDQLSERVAQLGALDEKAMQIDDLALRVAQIDVLTGQLSQLNARVTAQAEFGAQLSSVRDRITELQQQLEAPRTDTARDDELRLAVAALTARMAATDGLASQLGELAEKVGRADDNARQSAEQVAALEQRVDSIGTELANQISELGRDIDGLAERTAEVASGTVSDEVMAALRSGQIKLANEQARYEIAFREDLAALAEQVRRQPPQR